MGGSAAETPGTAAAVPGELAIVKRTLAAAYRQIAGWWDDDTIVTMYSDLAVAVEAFSPGDACCPCCEEVTCDTGCPLEPVRR